MNGRGMHISNPARLFMKHACICVEPKGQEGVTIPLEDLSYIVLDTPEVSITSACLGACAEQGCLIISVNARHMPNGLFLPFHTFYRQQETLHAQINLTLPIKKRLWQCLIQSKIRNQAASLAKLGFPRDIQGKVAMMEQKVASGDPTNVEAQAARTYFRHYTEHFKRDANGEDRLNAMLNYGYALLRAAIARNLAALGFAPGLGVHHRSMDNAFNLADDMIEPWRPFVDVLAMELWRQFPDREDLVKEDKQALAGIFHAPVLFEQGECAVLQGLRRQCEQLRGYLCGELLPHMPEFAPAIRVSREA